MNSKLFFTTLGLSALTVGLVAVPGSTARKQESPGTEGHKSSRCRFRRKRRHRWRNCRND